MRIGGLQKLSLIDYPGKVAAVVFTQGCNFRCGYCQNPQLVCAGQFQKSIDESVVFDFLKSRQGRLQGVVVTGGEPTVQKGLVDFLAGVKSMGYAVKLDTNGSRPQVVKDILERNLVDFIAMDIKTSLTRYQEVVGVYTDVDCLKDTITIIRRSGLSHQFRTTMLKGHCSIEDLRDIQALIGQSPYVLQSFVPLSTIIDPGLLNREQYTLEEVEVFQLELTRGLKTVNRLDLVEE